MQLWIIMALVLAVGASDIDSSNFTTCVPFGKCSPCSDTDLHESFCQPFGNRILLHCVSENYSSSEDHIPQGEVPVWEGCGRIVEQETRDFWEFVLCNAVMVALTLFLIFTRLKLLDALRSRNLAARIGLHGR